MVKKEKKSNNAIDDPYKERSLCFRKLVIIETNR
jgi:hypothetical protein